MSLKLPFKAKVMKVLVTGATGGLGRLIINQLLLTGCKVVATSRNSEKAHQSDFFDKVTYIQYDINDKTSLDLFSYFGKPDSVIHLAWEKLDDYKNEAHLTTILENHKAFIFNLLSHGLKDFNGIGTCYEYGIKEGLLKEDFESVPVLPYSQAKNALREFIESLSITYSFNFKWVRVFYVFGDTGGRKNLYSNLITAIKHNDNSFNMSGGEQIRDFLSPNEVAKKIVEISIQNKVIGIINCCSGKPIKLKDFIDAFLSTNSYQIKLNLGYFPYPDYEPMMTWGSTEKFDSIKNNSKKDLKEG